MRIVHFVTFVNVRSHYYNYICVCTAPFWRAWRISVLSISTIFNLSVLLLLDTEHWWTVDSCNQVIQLNHSPTPPTSQTPPPPPHLNGSQKGLGGGTLALLSSFILPPRLHDCSSTNDFRGVALPVDGHQTTPEPVKREAMPAPPLRS